MRAGRLARWRRPGAPALTGSTRPCSAARLALDPKPDEPARQYRLDLSISPGAKRLDATIRKACPESSIVAAALAYNITRAGDQREGRHLWLDHCRGRPERIARRDLSDRRWLFIAFLDHQHAGAEGTRLQPAPRQSALQSSSKHRAVGSPAAYAVWCARDVSGRAPLIRCRMDDAATTKSPMSSKLQSVSIMSAVPPDSRLNLSSSPRRPGSPPDAAHGDETLIAAKLERSGCCEIASQPRPPHPVGWIGINRVSSPLGMGVFRADGGIIRRVPVAGGAS